MRLMAVVMLAGSLLGAGGHAEEAAVRLEIGAPVPDFEARALDGEPISLRAALDTHKAVVVLFLSAICPYVRYFSPHLHELNETYGAKGVVFLGVNTNRWESRGEVAEQARDRGLAFAMIKEDDHQIADRLGVTRTPEAFLIDSEGRLRYRGWIKSKKDSPDLQRAIEALLAGRRVPRPLTKAYGCSVDR